ncbi:unnamed protein product [Calypogeia fissa]
MYTDSLSESKSEGMVLYSLQVINVVRGSHPIRQDHLVYSTRSFPPLSSVTNKSAAKQPSSLSELRYRSVAPEANNLLREGGVQTISVSNLREQKVPSLKKKLASGME